MSGAPDREPVDSAVRVTVPTQRPTPPKTGTAISISKASKKKTLARVADIEDDDNVDGRRLKKRFKSGKSLHLNEMVVVYEASAPWPETELYKRLYNTKTSTTCARHFKNARRTLAELGPCAADLLWRRAVEDDIAAMESKTSPEVRQTVEAWTFDMPNTDPNSTHYNVSSHICKLVEVLQCCETHNPAFRGLVVVKRPVTAVMVVELLKRLEDTFPDLRPYAIAGPNAFEHASEIQALLDEIEAGTHNLIVTTKYAEYLELPRLSLIVHYNLFEKPPAHILVRAHSDTALMVYFLEHNNDLHKRYLKSYREAEAVLADSTTKTSAPHAADENTSDSEDELQHTEYTEDPTTGRRIYQSDAVAVLNRLSKSNHQPLSFQIKENKNGKYFSTVNFSIRGVQRTIEGTAQTSSSAAKESAGYRLCRLLFDKGLLDYHLFPAAAFSSSNSAVMEGDKDGQASKTSATTRCYPRKLPQFWANTLPVFKDRLYLLIISVGQFRDGHHAPILILTRSWLPSFSDFPAHSSGTQTSVQMRRAAPVCISEAKLNTLYCYTLRMSRAVLNKHISCPIEAMPYFVAPMSREWDIAEAECDSEGLPVVDIPWDGMEKAAENWAVSLLPSGGRLPDEQAEDTIIQDRGVEFTNRYFLVKVCDDLTPLSKAGPDEREAGHASFLEYCKSRRKEPLELKDENQALIEVLPVPPCVNNLSPMSRLIASPVKFPAKHLIPELCYKFTIPASTFRTALLLPSVLHTIDSFLLVKEMNASLFDNAIAEDHLHAAVVCPTANMQYDYERLELLGDAFLKIATSTYFYVTMQNTREGALHAARQRLITNKALRAGAIEAGISPYIQSKPMVPKIWQPYMYGSEDGTDQRAEVAGDAKETGDSREEGMDVDVVPPDENAAGSTKQEERKRPAAGKRKRQREEHVVQWLGDKTVADVVEAIIGAAYLTAGRDLALRVTKILHVPLPFAECWSDFTHYPNPTNDSSFKLSAQVIKGVQKIVKYDFKRPALLAEALAHSSLSNNEVKNYDRLEFLGDAILDFLTVKYLFHNHPNMSPGPLSLLKAAMVSNATLAAICVLTGLYEYLQFASSDLTTQITLYAARVHTLHDEEHGTAAKEQRLPRQFWVEIESPKALSDIVESIMAAIYVSEGYDIAWAEKFFNDLLTPFFERHIRLQTLSDHPNTTLTDLFHAGGCQQHSVVKQADGSVVQCDVVVHGVTLSSAEDPLSNSALRKATMAALDVLANDPGLMTRICDCRATRQSKKAQKKQQQQAKQDATPGKENTNTNSRGRGPEEGEDRAVKQEDE